MFFRQRAFAVTVSCAIVLGSCLYLAFVELIRRFIEEGMQGVISRIRVLDLLGMGWPVISPRAFGDFETHRLNFCLWVLLAALSAKAIQSPIASYFHGLFGVAVVAASLFISRHEMCNSNYSLMPGEWLLIPTARFSVWIVAINIYAGITSIDWLGESEHSPRHRINSDSMATGEMIRPKPKSALLRMQMPILVLSLLMLSCLLIVVFADGVEYCLNIQEYTLDAIRKADLINLWPFGEMPIKHSFLVATTYSICWLALAYYVARKLVLFSIFSVRNVLATTAIVAFYFSDYSRFITESYYAKGHERNFTAVYELAVFVLLTTVYLATKYSVQDIRTNRWLKFSLTKLEPSLKNSRCRECLESATERE